LLLDSGGNEQWRKDDLLGAAESVAFTQDKAIEQASLVRTRVLLSL
jgi:hypothetical protein